MDTQSKAPAAPLNIATCDFRDNGSTLLVAADLTGASRASKSGKSDLLAYQPWTRMVHPELGEISVTFTVRKDAGEYAEAKQALRQARERIKAFRAGQDEK